MPGCFYRFLNGIGPEGGAILDHLWNLRKLIKGQKPDTGDADEPQQFLGFLAVVGRQQQCQRRSLRLLR